MFGSGYENCSEFWVLGGVILKLDILYTKRKITVLWERFRLHLPHITIYITMLLKKFCSTKKKSKCKTCRQIQRRKVEAITLCMLTILNAKVQYSFEMCSYNMTYVSKLFKFYSEVWSDWCPRTVRLKI